MRWWLLSFVVAGSSLILRHDICRTASGLELTLSPAPAENTDKYRLVPSPTEQRDEDAVPLYIKAVQLLPKDFSTDQISKWRGMPLDKMPLKEVAEAVKALRPSLQMVEQAAKYRKCNWPAVPAGATIANLQEYRWLANSITLQSSLQMAQGQYQQAVNSIGAGFVMAEHIGKGPTLVQGLVGVAIAELMCREVEKLIQVNEAPNLYWALRGLPRPVVDISRAMGIEKANLQQYKDPATRKQLEETLKPAHARVELTVKRLDRHVTALQCIEAIRHFAATHDSKFPKELGDITGIALPNDPVTEKPFAYILKGSTATLEGLTPSGGTEKDVIRYELKLKQ